MSKSGEVFLQLELKYCERCGGLWLRPKGSEQVFCSPCAPLMQDLPRPRPRRKSDSRLPVGPPTFDLEGGVIELFAIAAEERP